MRGHQDKFAHSSRKIVLTFLPHKLYTTLIQHCHSSYTLSMNKVYFALVAVEVVEPRHRKNHSTYAHGKPNKVRYTIPSLEIASLKNT